jgi:hypothetical protein
MAGIRDKDKTTAHSVGQSGVVPNTGCRKGTSIVLSINIIDKQNANSI